MTVRQAAGLSVVFTSCALLSCGGAARGDVRVNLPSPVYKTYPVSAYKSRGLRLLPNQRQWIEKILHSASYHDAITRLRFAKIRGVKTPIVVYIEDYHTPDDSIDHGGHVIGEYCSVIFDPHDKGLFAGSQASCSPPTPKPV